MPDPVIRVEGLSKRYLVGHEAARTGRESFREAATRWGRGMLRTAGDAVRGRAMVAGDEVEEFWALSDVSFEVERGEVLGVIGLNGAGKSTLLKILSRITEPTRGRVTLDGRVASLLEVGTGMHPELTGRENVYLNGAILGMSRAEIDRKFDEIVEFAEVERFLDTPVKRYSSGMHVRLAFSVAAHLEPEILVIDEVLAVGDLVFQKKCLGKMQRVAESGRTVLFVSHNMQTVTGLTTRALLLEAGRVVAMGTPARVVEQYVAAQTTEDMTYTAKPTWDRPEITRVELETSGPSRLQQHGKPFAVNIEITTPEPIPNSALSFQIMTAANQPVLHVLNNDSEVPMLRSAGVHRLRCVFPRLRLYPGHYYFRFHFGASEPRHVFDAPKHICAFEVAVIDQVRDFYWYPDHALYVEDVQWAAEALPVQSGDRTAVAPG
jgi:lipopolysaccharide transport system ATP-binding protein